MWRKFTGHLAVPWKWGGKNFDRKNLAENSQPLGYGYPTNHPCDYYTTYNTEPTTSTLILNLLYRLLINTILWNYGNSTTANLLLKHLHSRYSVGTRVARASNESSDAHPAHARAGWWVILRHAWNPLMWPRRSRPSRQDPSSRPRPHMLVREPCEPTH